MSASAMASEQSKSISTTSADAEVRRGIDVAAGRETLSPRREEAAPWASPCIPELFVHGDEMPVGERGRNQAPLMRAARQHAGARPEIRRRRGHTNVIAAWASRYIAARGTGLARGHHEHAPGRESRRARRAR